MAAEKTMEENVSSAESVEKAELKKKEPQPKAGKRGTLPAEPEYRTEELADSAKTIFGTRKECVLAALKAAGKKEKTAGRISIQERRTGRQCQKHVPYQKRMCAGVPGSCKKSRVYGL